MLPSSQNPEIRQQPTVYDNDSTNHNHSNRLHSEIRQQRRHQYAQGYHPYAMSGTGSRHRKHKSQPTNFLSEDDYIFSAARNSLMHSSLGIHPLYTITQQDEGQASDNARFQSLPHSSEHSTQLDDVTGNPNNIQNIPQFNNTDNSPMASHMNTIPLSPGSPYTGMLTQRQARFAQQFAQQPQLYSQIQPISNTEKDDATQSFPPSASIRAMVPTKMGNVNFSHFRRHSLDVSPYRHEEPFFSTFHTGLPSPPNTAPLMSISQFDMAPMPHPAFASIASLTMVPDGTNEEEYYSPDSSSDDGVSIGRPSPKMQSMETLASSQDFAPGSPKHIDESFQSTNNEDGLGVTLPSNHSQPATARPSISRMGSSAIYDTDDFSSHRDSGVSNEEISSYIAGPEAVDGKWVCLFQDCNKRFGRKENIKSHVQTHLGDRQFRCEVCKKCFVRQHDLKRHSKIHTGVKPYPCKCGNSFARHDALTRHRQRGMCIGAFEGIVKKIVKRGRPKKIRDPLSDDSTHEKGKKSASQTGSSSRSTSLDKSSPPPTNGTVKGLQTSHDYSRMTHDAANSTPESMQDEQRKRKRSDTPDSGSDPSMNLHPQRKFATPLKKLKTQVDQNNTTEPELVSATSPVYSVPSSPAEEFGDEVTTPGNQLSFEEAQYGPFEGHISFTPVGSPEYEILHRRFASVYNTPEWAPQNNQPSIAEQQVDLRDILGLSNLEDDTNTLSFELSNATEWTKTANMSVPVSMGMNLNMAMGINLGLEMGLEDGFDFIKSELLHDDNLELWNENGQ